MVNPIRSQEATAEPVQIVEVLPTKIWIENGMLGERTVMVQHQGMEPFEYAVFNYRYGYTDNLSTYCSAENLARSLGATEPVEHRQRALPPTTTKIQCNEDGSLDEVFGTGDFHLEQMDSNHWWMALETSAGRVVVNLRARGKITAYVEADPPLPTVPSVDHPTEREAFETYARTKFGRGMVVQASNGPYVWDVVNDAWAVWRARAACFAGGSPAKDVEAPAAINQEWISVEDRLPDCDIRVMFWNAGIAGGHPCVGFKETNDSDSTKWLDELSPDRNGGPMDVYNVSHWMSLPAAPTGADT